MKSLGPVNIRDTDVSVEAYELEPVNEFEGTGIALVVGSLATMKETEIGPLVRFHSRCLYGEVFGALDCDCKAQLDAAKAQIAQESSGILFYLNGQEGRGAGLIAKAMSYELMEKEGLDTAAAYKKLGIPYDQRQYGHCVRFLQEADIKRIRMMSNNPSKFEGLDSSGIVVERVSLVVGVNETNKAYLQTKRDKAGHMLPDDL